MKKHDLDPLPFAHPRQVPTEMARREIFGWVMEWREKHRLTLSEELMLIAELLENKLARCVKIEREKDE